MILNLPPTVTGQIPDDWAAPAIEFGKALRASFAAPVATLLSKAHQDGRRRVSCGAGAPPLLLPIPAGTGPWNAVRSSEDVLQDGQLVSAYYIEALVDGKWVNATSRGQSVGVGTVDLVAGQRTAPMAAEQPTPPPPLSRIVTATQLRWHCLAARRQTVTLTGVDLYLATPPT